ncbi:50S ribosomal protein L15 [Patescibacteria group bacterium]|nr:50S ribosomal protein L15 [Patescibacteria group bacterium]MBU1029477.1 50S ribosomal protein L15 [Patescibacteria group bacterium]MBU1915821.1 50S ribosomal protein L15 [Patescibacteria group bacterium]
MAALKMHNLKSSTGSRGKSKRVGRGNASGKGTTAGRGTKGQAARTGGRNRRKLRGLRSIMLATPKLRGFKSFRPKPTAVSVAVVATIFPSGTEVSPTSLLKAGLIDEVRYGVKIIGSAKLKKKLIISDECSITAGARRSVEEAGGQVK